jgi:hypothetical protein
MSTAFAHDKFAALVQEEGMAVANHPEGLRGRLRALCGDEHRAAINLLVIAAGDHVPRMLHEEEAEKSAVPALVARLTQRLAEQRGIAADKARWAVESWACALGLLDRPPVGLSANRPARPAKAAGSAPRPSWWQWLLGRGRRP